MQFNLDLAFLSLVKSPSGLIPAGSGTRTSGLTPAGSGTRISGLIPAGSGTRISGLIPAGSGTRISGTRIPAGSGTSIVATVDDRINPIAVTSHSSIDARISRSTASHREGGQPIDDVTAVVVEWAANVASAEALAAVVEIARTQVGVIVHIHSNCGVVIVVALVWVQYVNPDSTQEWRVESALFRLHTPAVEVEVITRAYALTLKRKSSSIA